MAGFKEKPLVSVVIAQSLSTKRSALEKYCKSTEFGHEGERSREVCPKHCAEKVLGTYERVGL